MTTTRCAILVAPPAAVPRARGGRGSEIKDYARSTTTTTVDGRRRRRCPPSVGVVGEEKIVGFTLRFQRVIVAAAGGFRMSRLHRHRTGSWMVGRRVVMRGRW